MELATDRFGFVHKKFQEYFAARWIANEVLLNFDLQIMIDYVNKYIYDISWHEILILALSALPQKQAKTILDHILTLGKIPPFYLKSISLENVKCFKGTHFLNLSNENKPANWTVILGNNGTGKTTLLQCIASLDPLHLKEGTRFADVNKEEQEFEIACHETKNPIQSLVGKIFYDLEDNSPQVKFLVENIDIVYHKYFEGKESGNFYAPIVYAYGASRKSGESLLTGESKSNRHDNLFYDKDLMNAEEWLAQADYASRKTNALAETNLKKIKKILLDILPDVKGFDFKTSENLRNYVEFLTDYGSVRFKDLSLGYRVMISWIVDLARQMFERYPSSSDPLSEPAIVLVDEIDLHLHPSWQRDIIHFLAKHFKKTQFIVTAHSPLIVQSAENVNVVLLQKDIAKGSVSISNEINVTYNGWTLEEILSDLMGLEKTVSDKYLLLTQKFEKAIYEDDAAAAKKIYDKLDKILHPENHLRKLMRIQMAALRGEGVE
jgi:predicted ATP-binding protein involved in virulence